jgi:hypothetical protein
MVIDVLDWYKIWWFDIRSKILYAIK